MSRLGRPPEDALLAIASIRTSVHERVARAYEKGSDDFVGTFRPPPSLIHWVSVEVTAE